MSSKMTGLSCDLCKRAYDTVFSCDHCGAWACQGCMRVGYIWDPNAESLRRCSVCRKEGQTDLTKDAARRMKRMEGY